MQKIGVLVENKELVLVMRPAELGSWLNQRRLDLVGTRVADIAEALEITRTQASALLTGRVPFGKRMIERLNAIDSEFEVMQLVGIVRKEKAAISLEDDVSTE